MDITSRPVLCVGLTPAFQKVYHFRKFTFGAVNRASDVTESASGKGINVGRVLRTLNKPIIITGFLGGDTGAFIEKYLNEEGLKHHFVRTKAKTRTCTTIIASDGSAAPTELVEEGRTVSPEEVSEFLALFHTLLPECGIVAISGTVPLGVESEFYLKLITEANRAGIPVILDTQKELLWNALEAHTLFVKPNLHELEAALNLKLDSDTKIWKAIEQILGKGARCVLISNEDKASYVSVDGKNYKVVPPKIRAVNAIGCGDSVTAGLAAALLEGKSCLESVIFGTACGSASALTTLPGFLDPAELPRLIGQVEVIPQ